MLLAIDRSPRGENGRFSRIFSRIMGISEPQVWRPPPFPPEGGVACAQLRSRAQSAQHVVVVRHGGAEQRHHCVADVLIDRTAVPCHDLIGSGEIAVNQRMQAFIRQVARQRIEYAACRRRGATRGTSPEPGCLPARFDGTASRLSRARPFDEGRPNRRIARAGVERARRPAREGIEHADPERVGPVDVAGMEHDVVLAEPEPVRGHRPAADHDPMRVQHALGLGCRARSEDEIGRIVRRGRRVVGGLGFGGEQSAEGTASGRIWMWERCSPLGRALGSATV